MLYVVERINREYGSHFDFVVNSIFPELIQCLEQSYDHLFFVGDPDIFHERYSSWLKFIDDLKSILSKTSEETFKKSKTYLEFSSRWDLVVYYQIRFQEISSRIEHILVNKPFTLIEDKNLLYKTLITLTIFQSIDHCWQTNIFLETLSHQFWKLTLQCIIRYSTWIDTLNVNILMKIFNMKIVFIYIYI